MFCVSACCYDAHQLRCRTMCSQFLTHILFCCSWHCFATPRCCGCTAVACTVGCGGCQGTYTVPVLSPSQPDSLRGYVTVVHRSSANPQSINCANICCKGPNNAPACCWCKYCTRYRSCSKATHTQHTESLTYTPTSTTGHPVHVPPICDLSTTTSIDVSNHQDQRFLPHCLRWQLQQRLSEVVVIKG